MKLPSEADLIELENFIARWKPDEGPVKRATEEMYRDLRAWNTLKTLISLARDPSKLLRDIPDDLLDRALDRISPYTDLAYDAFQRNKTHPRTSVSEPAASALPKRNKWSRPKRKP